jgi:two-component system, NtrC family, response regulator AtoC
LTVLIAEDDSEVRSYLEVALKCCGYDVEFAEDGEQALELLREAEGRIAAVLLDLVMPRRSGLELLRDLREDRLEIPVIVISGASAPGNVVEAMRLGAADFLPKPVSHEDLERILGNAVGAPAEEPGPAPPPAEAGHPSVFQGASERVREIRELVRRVAPTEAPVLIQGETGAGKEVLARELHARSARADRPFLKLNCAALPSELVESELFGYERGAFTGAVQRKEGMFELADTGTILLDEIGDMPLRLQAKLLQVLQDHEFQRLGGKETIRVDVRVLAATHHDLEAAIFNGTFREDLYYRLNVIAIDLPPLRERRDDIVPLCHYFMKKYAMAHKSPPALSSSVCGALLGYSWPGNIRELENIVRRMVIVGDMERIAADLRSKTLRHLPAMATNGSARAGSNGSESILAHVSAANRHAEADAILSALHSTHWNRKKAARLLKIDYKALLYKMKKLAIDGGSAPETV